MSRRRILASTTAAVSAIAVTAVLTIPPRIVWNATPSVPIGLYFLDAGRTPALGDLVAVLPEHALARFLVERGYVGCDVPLLKHVAAFPGQQVCRDGASVSVDGVPVANALARDRLGRPLPVWSGCRIVAGGQIFLMNPAVRDSLDGRYFGPIPARSVIGVATPLFTDEAASGHFIWRASAAPALRDTASIPTNQKENDHADR